MATMNVSLPDEMKAWVEGEVKTGRYSNASDYVRDLIRADQVREQKLTRLRALVAEGLESGVSDKSGRDIIAEFEKRAAVAADT